MEGHQEGAKKRNIKCDICAKTFREPKQFEKHKRLHENDSSLAVSEMYYKYMAEHFDMTCDRCDAKFTAFLDAREHYKDVHNGYYF